MQRFTLFSIAHALLCASAPGCSSSEESTGDASEVDAAAPGDRDASAPGDGEAGCRTMTGWTRAAENPVGSSRGGSLSPSGVDADPWILRDGEELRLWFTTTAMPDGVNVLRTAYAQSTDGVACSLKTEQ